MSTVLTTDVELKHFEGDLEEYSDAEKQQILGYAKKYWKDVTSADGQITVSQDQMRKRWALARPRLNEEGWGIVPVDTLFIDEAQDTPPVLAKVYSDNKSYGVQLVVVGDPDQAINGFTGAINYMDDVGPEMQTHLPLEKSYRYGPEVADIANRFLQFKQSLGRVFGGGRKSEIVQNMEDPKAILTRTNAGMLGHVWEEMVDKGRKVGVPQGTKQDLKHLIKSAQALKFRWKNFQMHDDFAEYDSWEEFTKAAMSGDDAVAAKNFRIFGQVDFDQMTAMIDNLIETNPKADKNSAQRRADIAEVFIRNEVPNGSVIDFGYNSGFKITDYKDMLEQHGFAKGPTGDKYKRPYTHPNGTKYKAGDLKPAEKWMHTGTPEERDAAFAKIFDEIVNKDSEQPDVTISTAHKAKGLEWESVKIGDDFKAPKRDDDGNMIMPSEEEINLAYVAVTRAERRLDPGSLAWIFELTDENGGVRPTEKPDPNDLDARAKEREEQLDDQKRHDAHVAENTGGVTAPATPERPERTDEAHNGDTQTPGDPVTVPGVPPGLDNEINVRETESGDHRLDNGWSFDFNDKDAENKMGVTLYDPQGNEHKEVMVDDDLTMDELTRDLNRVAAGQDDYLPGDDAPTSADITPDEVPDQNQTFEQRYPDLTGDEDPADVARKADELKALTESMDRSDPQYLDTMIKALAYSDAARGNGKLAAIGNLSDESAPGPAVDDADGHRELDPNTDHQTSDAVNDFGYVETQIPSVDDNTEIIDWQRVGKSNGIMWDLDQPGYFARVTKEQGGEVRVQIFRENGNKPPIPVDNFTASAQDTSPGKLTHLALDSVTRHKNSRRKRKPDETDLETGRRVFEAAKTGNYDNLSQQELEWAVQLEYTVRNDDNLNFDVLEQAIRDGRNPTMTNFLKYMRDQDGAFRFWAKGNEAGSKMRVGDHAWQWFEDTDKGRAFRRGEGPPDVRHGRIVALPTHSQPNATIWAHDENGQPMWVEDPKTGEMIPHLYRYHLNRVTKFHGLDEDGFALDSPRPNGTATTPTPEGGPPIDATIGADPNSTDPAVLEGTPDVPGVRVDSNWGKRVFGVDPTYDATAEEQFDRMRQVTKNWDDLRHGDAFVLGSDMGTLQYDEETDQMFLYGINGQYYGAQDGFDFRDEDTTQLTNKLADPSNGFDRVEQTQFTPVPPSHYKLHYAIAGPGAEAFASEIEHYHAMGGHEIKIMGGHSVSETHAANFASEAHKALRRMGASLEGLKMQFYVPTYDPAFDSTTPKAKKDGFALAFVQPIRPNVIQVNPGLMQPSVSPASTNSFMPIAHQHPHNVEYTLIHEFGHVIDGIRQDVWSPLGRANIHKINVDFWNRMKIEGSAYGTTDPVEGYAEAWAQWVLGGPGSNRFSDAYAEMYGWECRTNSVHTNPPPYLGVAWYDRAYG